MAEDNRNKPLYMISVAAQRSMRGTRLGFFRILIG